MNDDFLYKRQEAPDPAFVAKLQEELQSLELPEKAKRKNGQRRLNWQKLVAAIFVLVTASLVIASQPKLRDPIINIFIDDANYDILADANSRYGFELPTLPSRYEFVSANYASDMTELLEMRWQATDHVCVIRLRVQFPPITDPESGLQVIPQPSAEILGTNLQLAGDISIMYGGNSSRIRSSWGLSNATAARIFSLETGKGCLSEAEITSIAQSTLP